MRVTDKIMSDQMRTSVMGNRDKLFVIQQKIAENRKLVYLSDDPRASEKVSQLKATQAEMEQFKRNISFGKASLDMTLNALDGMSELLVRARELAVQFSGSDYNAQDRQIAANEVDEIYKQMVSYANTKNGSDYLFSGFNSNVAAYSSDYASGQYGVWQGDTGTKVVRIGPGETMAINEPGVSIFGTRASAGPPPVAGSGVMEDLDAFRTALRNNDIAGIQNALATMDTAMQTVQQSQAAIGTRIKHMEIADTALTTLSNVVTTQISDLQDLDIAEVSTELTKQEAILQAAIQVAGRISSMSLLDALQ